ncbi:unnamed protein product [Didymodactylos carnosus]|uniref:Ubiquitin carboxyl-terminal hydrolase n=1 Tax=Didymodactylos carnosus TaxID=1234261 RepID=A0A813SD93_9BILA|nr:unnamed protein product [Didymodactylos carnosus]CAF1150493.1 unnamed protein product [Didymodactylos carnosus]CAF3577299.1 unnamed protein product [Didymodactylos carnosus]CAF3956667.1 unnamed protein product [Didymodactylos carnosus]
MGHGVSVDSGNNVTDTTTNEHFLGLVNFGNTCYCNSVLQALYFCKPFREHVLHYRLQQKNKKENLLTCLADLFYMIVTVKRRTGAIPPKKFISKLRKENSTFDNDMQQDAHEFLNHLLNTCADILIAEKKEEKDKHDKQRMKSNGSITINKNNNNNSPQCNGTTIIGEQQKQEQNCYNHTNPRSSISTSTDDTWIHDLFQGTLVNETKCLNCETYSSKDENFLDLSIDVEENTSITTCLRVFSNVETLRGESKYYCETCSSKQEATKRMRIKKLPRILALHLKRFKYIEQCKQYKKLSYRVVFPFELRLLNTSEDCLNSDRIYDLVSLVVHCGIGPNRGHYIAVVKSQGSWIVFDDENVDRLDPTNFEEFYGVTHDLGKQSETSYILFYESRDPS